MVIALSLKALDKTGLQIFSQLVLTCLQRFLFFSCSSLDSFGACFAFANFDNFSNLCFELLAVLCRILLLCFLPLSPRIFSGCWATCANSSLDNPEKLEEAASSKAAFKLIASKALLSFKYLDELLCASLFLAEDFFLLDGCLCW